MSRMYLSRGARPRLGSVDVFGQLGEPVRRIPRPRTCQELGVVYSATVVGIHAGGDDNVTESDPFPQAARDADEKHSAGPEFGDRAFGDGCRVDRAHADDRQRDRAVRPNCKVADLEDRPRGMMMWPQAAEMGAHGRVFEIKSGQDHDHGRLRSGCRQLANRRASITFSSRRPLQERSCNPCRLTEIEWFAIERLVVILTRS